jgi:DNA-binding beta-propeller fold protein YncE
MKKAIVALIPLALFAQIEVDSVIRLPTAFVINGQYLPELNKLYVIGWYEHIALDCSTYEVLARIPISCDKAVGYYSWNRRRQKLYICYNPGEDSVAVVDAVADTLVTKIPRVGDAGVYVGSTDRFYRPIAHTGLVAIDCATDTVVSTIPPPLPGYGFSHPSWDSVHNKIYVAVDCWGYPDKLAVYDCATESLLTLIDVPSRPNVMNFDYAQHKAYYTNWDAGGPAGAIDIEHDTVTRIFPFQSSPLYNGVALDTIDGKAYILGADTLTGYSALYVVDCATDSIVKMLAFPHRPWGVDHLRWVPWSNRVYLTRTQASSHQNLGMYVVDCKTDSIIVSDLVLGYYPPFDFQIDPIRERVFAIGCESTSVHVLRDVEGGVAEEPAPRPAVTATARFCASSSGVLVEYQLPVAAHVRASLHDAVGRRIGRLDAGEQKAGLHQLSWSRDQEGRRLSAGAYFVRLNLGAEQARLKAVLR